MKIDNIPPHHPNFSGGTDPQKEAKELVEKFEKILADLLAAIGDKNIDKIQQDRSLFQQALKNLSDFMNTHSGSFSPSEKELLNQINFQAKYFNNLFDNDFSKLSETVGPLFGLAQALKIELRS